jgi:hypothetical protein
MPRYEVTYFRGHDHDDWDKAQFEAVDADEAKHKALDVIPPGHRVKRIKEIQNPNTMEQTTKIQNITPQGTFDYNGKTFHKFDVILENGMVGEVNAMTPDKWKEGDECVVKEQNTTKWGPRLKLDKPGFNGGGSSSPKAPANNDVKGIVASWAVACAMQAAGDPFQKDYDSIVLQLARVALSARKVIKDEVEV